MENIKNESKEIRKLPRVPGFLRCDGKDLMQVQRYASMWHFQVIKCRYCGTVFDLRWETFGGEYMLCKIENIMLDCPVCDTVVRKGGQSDTFIGKLKDFGKNRLRQMLYNRFSKSGQG